MADSYDDPKALVGEVWLPDIDRFTRYLRPDEMHTAFNFDFLARPWDAAELARVDRRDARRARPGRRPGDLGALEPRRDPARHPLRTRRIHRLPSRPSAAASPTDVSSWAPAARGPPPCLRPRFPGRSTSTRVTSSGLTRSRTYRSAGSRTRWSIAPAASTPAATAVACPSPGRAFGRHSDLARTDARATPVAAAAGALGRPDGRNPGCRPRFDALALSNDNCPAACRARPPDRCDALAAIARRCAGLRPWRAHCVRRQPGRRSDRPAFRARRCSSRAHRSMAGGCRADSAAWIHLAGRGEGPRMT